MQNLQKFLIIPVINIWPELVASTVKQIKTARSAMKIVFFNGLCHISINGSTSYSKEPKAVVTTTVESMICPNDSINQINHML